MGVPEAVLVAVSGALARRARGYCAGQAVRESGKFILWVLGWVAGTMLVPRDYRALAWLIWGAYLAGGAALAPSRGRLRLSCPPGVALRLAVEMLLYALSRSGGALARAAAWVVVGGRGEERPKWLHPDLEALAVAFLLAAGVARRHGDAIVCLEPGEIIRGPSDGAGAPTNSPTDRSRAESLPP